MKIKCTVQELKELIESKKETSAAETTDVNIKLDGKEIISSFFTKFYKKGVEEDV